MQYNSQNEKKKEIHRKQQRNRIILIILTMIVWIAVVAMLCLIGINLFSKGGKSDLSDAMKIGDTNVSSDIGESEMESADTVEPDTEYVPAKVDDSLGVSSKYIYMYDDTDNRVICEKDSRKIVKIASLTKIMTAIVAIENIDDLETKYTMPLEIVNYMINMHSSIGGFVEGEEVTAKDMIYASILASGGDGAMGLANMVSGNQEDFVELMNEKAKELGMNDTLFTNVTGFDEGDNHSTAYDTFIMFDYALKIPFFKEMLANKSYTTKPTNKHSEGVTMLSTLFTRFEKANLDPKSIIGGKTGFTGDAGLCLASCCEYNGKQYVLITLGAGDGSDEIMYHVMDAAKLYDAFVYKAK